MSTFIDIKGKSADPRAARPSNFTRRRFIYRGPDGADEKVPCESLESILQAIKTSDWNIQKEFCLLTGRDVQVRGQAFNSWKDIQTLWWHGVPYHRHGHEYVELVTSFYDAAYAGDPTFKEDLRALGNEEIRHTIGKSDMRDTVLTEVELLYQLNRLRIRAWSPD